MSERHGATSQRLTAQELHNIESALELYATDPYHSQQVVCGAFRLLAAYRILTGKKKANHKPVVFDVVEEYEKIAGPMPTKNGRSIPYRMTRHSAKAEWLRKLEQRIREHERSGV